MGGCVNIMYGGVYGITLGCINAVKCRSSRCSRVLVTLNHLRYAGNVQNPQTRKKRMAAVDGNTSKCSSKSQYQPMNLPQYNSLKEMSRGK